MRLQETADAIRRKRGMFAGDPAGPVPQITEEQINQVGEVDPADVEQAQALLEQQETQPNSASAGIQLGDDAELAAAQDADRRSRNAGRMELAAKQFVSGVTQTPVAGMSAPAPSRVPQAMAQAKSRREQAADALRRQREGRLDEEAKTHREMTRTEKAAALLRAQQQRAEDQRIAEDHFGRTEKRAKASSDAQLALANANLEVRKANRVEDQGDKEDKQVAELAKASGADVAMGHKALDEVDAAIAAGGGEAPGTGRLKSRAPDFMLSDDGNKVRQNANDALAIMLSARSGATVSTEELERNKGIYGVNGSPEQFADGMKRLRRDFESTLKAKQAGYGPEVKEKFVKRGGTLAGANAPATKTVGGKTYEKRADGKWYVVGGG